MTTFDLAVVTGDAPGASEAVATAIAVLEAAGLTVRRHDLDLGVDRYLRTAELLPAAELARIRSADALFCGSPPVGHDPRVEAGLLDRGIVFGLRRELGLTVNVRSFQGIHGRSGDVVVVRENSEGLYFGEGTVLHRGSVTELSTETSVATRKAARHCLQVAFELAAKRSSRLALVHKPRVLTASGRVWTAALAEVAADFPSVTAVVENVDTCCMRLVQDPSRYDVIVTDNVFGDIVSDVACAALDALDHSASAEYAYGDGPSLFEPVHGPQDNVGPRIPVSLVAAARAAALLAAHLGQDEVAHRIDSAALAAAAGTSRDRQAFMVEAITAATTS